MELDSALLLALNTISVLIFAQIKTFKRDLDEIKDLNKSTRHKLDKHVENFALHG